MLVLLRVTCCCILHDSIVLSLPYATIYGDTAKFSQNLPEGDYALGIMGDLKSGLLKNDEKNYVTFSYLGNFKINKSFVMVVHDFSNIADIGNIEFKDPDTGDLFSLFVVEDRG